MSMRSLEPEFRPQLRRSQKEVKQEVKHMDDDGSIEEQLLTVFIEIWSVTMISFVLWKSYVLLTVE